MKAYLVRETKSKEPVEDFDDFLEARDFMRKQQHVELVRVEDGVILSTKTSDNGITGVGFVRLDDLSSPIRIK